jgi:hypothetical protein
MFVFGDSFDLYATMADPVAGYWDSGLGVGAGNTLVAGRFAGGQALSLQGGLTTSGVKSSGANDAVHHIVVAFRQTVALSGTNLGGYFQLSDAATNQCCIVFRSDGAILLTSATPGGTVLATYIGAVSAVNTWTAFEFEVVISGTVGAFRARKNGNTSNDFDSGATLNTRPGANSYANKLTVGMNTTVNAQQFDDILWRSDASSVPWVGDVRCYTRMPASDASVQFTRLGGATNFSQVSEAHQDGATSYVYDATVGDADFYGIAAITGTPASVVAVTTRGFVQKSDAGTRSGAVQLKSGATTVASTTTALPTTFGWLWRTDQTDPATGAAWTPTAVNNVTIGPVVIV